MNKKKNKKNHEQEEEQEEHEQEEEQEEHEQEEGEEEEGGRPSQQKPFNAPSPSLQRPQSGLTSQTTPSTTSDLLAGLGSLNLTPSLSASIAAPTLLTSPPTGDPLSVLDNLTVALETIQPGKEREWVVLALNLHV